MPGSFYEILGIEADVSPEDIRKAYRKRALQTHPDRLQPGATAQDKEAAAEEFRKVNNAYEVLMDPKNRKLYDLYGVWPPPEELPEESRRHHGHRAGHRQPHHPFPSSDPFMDPRFNFPTPPFGDPFSRHHPAYAFRDPFELFNSMWADIHREMSPHDPFMQCPISFFDRSHSLLRPSLPPMLSPFPAFSLFPQMPMFPEDHRGSSSRPNGHAQSFSFQGSNRFYGSGSDREEPQWVSETRVVRTINGVTQSIRKRRDRHGNEHVTYTYPDGREQHTINGIEQSHSTGHIQGRPPSHDDDQDSLSAPIIPPEHGESSSRKRWWNRH